MLVLAALQAAPAGAGDFSRGPEPDWVEPLPLPAITAAERAELLSSASDGYLVELVDSQVHYDAQGNKQLYYRVATRVTDRAGLEYAAGVQLDFDPHSESRVLTRLDVIRDGQVLPWRDRLNAEIVRRETRLEAGIIDGTLTAVLQVPDLRVGDIVDVASVITTAPPFPGAPRNGQTWLEYSVPVGVTRHVLHWADDRPLHVAPLPVRVTHAVTVTATGQRHEWARRLHRPADLPDRLPEEAHPDALLLYAEAAEWSGLVDALLPFYDATRPVPDAWADRVAAIARDHADPDRRVIAALRLVQDDIRYVGIEVGAGGYFARDPAKVVADGFGDCKDKSLLLVTLLRALGVTAHVALTDTRAGYGLPGRLPSLGAFDHMIVRVEVDGQTFWLDPTGSHEGGTALKGLTTPGYGHVLPLMPGVAKVEPIRPNAEGRWQADVTESFDFGLFGVSFVVLSTYRGAAADWWRYEWATTPASEIGARFVEFYEQRYPGLTQVRPPAPEDDRDANILTVTERYFLPLAALGFDDDSLRADFPFGAEDYLADLRAAIRPSRDLPLLVGSARTLRHSVLVRNAPISFTPPDELVVENGTFSYRLRGEALVDGMMRLVWEFDQHARVAAPDTLARLAADARAVRDNSVFSWDLRP